MLSNFLRRSASTLGRRVTSSTSPLLKQVAMTQPVCSFHYEPEPFPYSKTLLSDYSVGLTFPLQWADMDVFGHINNVVYFRYIENSRFAYFQAMEEALHQLIGRSILCCVPMFSPLNHQFSANPSFFFLLVRFLFFVFVSLFLVIRLQRVTRNLSSLTSSGQLSSSSKVERFVSPLTLSLSFTYSLSIIFSTVCIVFFSHLAHIDLPAFHHSQGIGPIIKNTSMNFKRPLVFPDTVTVGGMVCLSLSLASLSLANFPCIRLSDSIPYAPPSPLPSLSPCSHTLLHHIPFFFTARVCLDSLKSNSDRFLMEHRLVSHGQDTIAAEGDGVLVMVDYAKRVKAPIPPVVRRAIELIEDSRYKKMQVDNAK